MKPLLLFACFAAFTSLATVASAEEPSPSVADRPSAGARVELATRASARRLLLEGDFTAARTVLDQLVAIDAAPEAHAADLELLYVLDAWASAGHRPARALASGLPEVSAAEEWPRAFAVAREALVRGAYTEADRRLDDVIVSAPGPVMTARAAELRTLAREAARRDAATARATYGVPAPPAAPPPPPPARREGAVWYGWQTLITDGAAVLTTPAVPLLGVGAYVLGAPLVHALHGRGWTALGSLGLRVGAPVTGGFVAYAVQGKCSGEFCAVWPLLGAGVGVVSAMALDAAVLARKPREPADEKPARAATAPRITPSAAPRREGGFDVGLSGSF